MSLYGRLIAARVRAQLQYRTSFAIETVGVFLVSLLDFVAILIMFSNVPQLGAWSVYAYERWQREIVASGRYFFDIALKYALPFVVWGLFVLMPQLKEREITAEGVAELRKALPTVRIGY